MERGGERPRPARARSCLGPAKRRKAPAPRKKTCGAKWSSQTVLPLLLGEAAVLPRKGEEKPRGRPRKTAAAKAERVRERGRNKDRERERKRKQ